MRWKESAEGETLCMFKPGCLVQVIGINSTCKGVPCNIKINDGKYWLDVDVDDSLKNHFVKNLIVENDILVLQKTAGTLAEKNVKLIAFVRPEWAQCGGVRQGQPLPLLENTLITSRKPNGRIVKRISYVEPTKDNDMFEEELARMFQSSPDEQVEEPPVQVQVQPEHGQITSEQNHATDEPVQHNTEHSTDPHWVFSTEQRLSQMLRNTQAAQPTIKDTPLSMLAVKTNKK